MTKDTLADRAERRLQEFGQSRERFENEILKLKTACHTLVDSIIDKFIQDVQPTLDETDSIIERKIEDLRGLLTKRREFDEIERKIGPQRILSFSQVVELLETLERHDK